MTRKCPFGPPSDYAAIRAEHPVSQVTLQDGSTAWMVTKHDLAREVLASPKVSSNRAAPGFPALFPNIHLLSRPGQFISADDPEHSRHRRKVTSTFTVKHVKTMQPAIQAITDAAIDAMLDGPTPVDLVQALSLPVPSLVICELLGVPYADRDFFQSRSSLLLNRNTTVEQRMVATDELRGYLGELIAVKETDPADDLLSRLIDTYRGEGEYDRDTLIGVANLLLVAGHETTANMISLSTASIVSDADLRRRVIDHPEATPELVEELLRYHSIVEAATSRAVVDDLTVGDTVIPAGHGVINAVGAANHDPDAFERPDVVDPDRGARHHLAFGFGVHQCLGQNLARAELEIAINTLFARVPDLELAVPLEDLPFKYDAGIYGIYRMPVRW
jgi:cytochrome P450